MDLDTLDHETAHYRVPFRATMTPDINNELWAEIHFNAYLLANDSLTFSATSATPSGTFLGGSTTIVNSLYNEYSSLLDIANLSLCYELMSILPETESLLHKSLSI